MVNDHDWEEEIGRERDDDDMTTMMKIMMMLMMIAANTILVLKQSYMATYKAHFQWYHQCLANYFHLIILQTPLRGHRTFSPRLETAA